MLKALAHLSGVGTRVINLSKDATIDTAAPARPGAEPAARPPGRTSSTRSSVALTYPFVDEVVGRDPQVARNLQMGDYTNLSIKLDLSLDQNGSLPIPTGLPTELPTLPTDLPTSLPTSEITKILGDVAKCLQSGDITSKACPKVLGDPQELLQPDREVQEGEARRQPGLPGAQRAAQPARPGRRAAVAEHPDQPAPDDPRRRRRPRWRTGRGVRATWADHAAADAGCTTPRWSTCSSPGW